MANTAPLCVCQVPGSLLRTVILQIVQQILCLWFELQYDEQYSCEELHFILSIHFVVLPFKWASGYFNNNNKILHFFFSFSVVIVEITNNIVWSFFYLFFCAFTMYSHCFTLAWTSCYFNKSNDNLINNKHFLQ